MLSDANCSRYNVMLSLHNAIGASIITLLVHIVELLVFRPVLVPGLEAASLPPGRTMPKLTVDRHLANQSQEHGLLQRG